MDLPAGTVVGGRYEVDQLLGRGGMATVYRVWHTGLGTCHALKVLQTVSESARERLLREGRLQGQLRHPNVVGVTDHVEVNGAPGLVLEMVEGPPLSALLGGPPLTLEQVDAIGGGVLAGVAEAHRHHLVHRDLKPGNVLVAVRDGRPLPKVADFGLALALEGEEPRRTRTGAHLGTPQYMSPEQVRDAKHVDERADVWSLGVLLYELATGALPFPQTDRLELFQAIASGAHVPVGERRPDLPPRMVEAIERALRPERDERPADAVAMQAIWAGATPEVVADPLVERVRSLAPPSSSRGSSGTPTPAAPMTWTPETRAEPPPEPPSSSRASSRASEAPAAPAAPAVAPAGTPLWVPILLVSALGGVVLLALVAVGAVAWVAGRAAAPPPAPVVVAPAVPAPVQEEEDEGPPRVLPVKARELLLEGRFAEAAHEASFLLAVPGTEAEVLVAVARRAQGDGYGPLEELERALRQEDPRVDAMLAMQTDPTRGEAWLREHPDDLEVRLWWVVHACPSPGAWWPAGGCATATAQVEAIRRLAPGRAATAWAEAVVARGQGRPDDAEAALADVESAQGTEVLAVERAWALFDRGRFEEAAAVVEPLLEDRSAPVGAAIVRGLAARELGREGDRVRVDDLVARQLWERQLAYARAVAGWERAHGRTREAAERLRVARHALDPYRDPLVKLSDLEPCLDLMELGADLGDPELLEQAAVGLGLVASADLQPWAKLAAERDRLLGDGLRLVGRRRPAEARGVLGQLRDAGASELEVARLTRRLDGGGG